MFEWLFRHIQPEDLPLIFLIFAVLVLLIHFIMQVIFPPKDK
jgi:hypothetical protein